MEWNERVKTGEKEDNRGIVPCLNCKCDICSQAAGCLDLEGLQVLGTSCQTCSTFLICCH